MASTNKRASALMRACWCLCLAFGTVTLTDAQASNNARTVQKRQAEAERAELQKKLKALQTDINKTESAKDKVSDALATSEQAISETNRSLSDLHSGQLTTEQKLQQLLAEQARLKAQVELQKKQLSDFLRHQYVRGDSDRIKLLLSGDNPNRINRDLQYMGYVSQTQAKMIAALRTSLQSVEKTTQDAQDAKEVLDDIAEEKRQHKTALESEKKRHAELLGQLANKLHAQKKEADSLQKDEKRLSSLVTRLNQIIEEQIKAEQAKAALLEKQKQERAERLAAEKLKRDKALVKQGKKPSKAESIDNDEPPKAVVKNEQTPLPGSNDGTEFAKLKGQLRLPVKGELIAKFGTRRGDGPSWKGLFIKAAEGAEIKAIAAGKVVFAEWLRGFGNMIIVDHGGQYLSLYSNNQAVLKHAGDPVKSGETIATAGNSGGNEESGLYFELRHQGRVFDPLSWVNFR